MIAGLYNIPVDDIGFDRFAFYNQDAHQQAAIIIQRRTGVLLPTFILQPIPKVDFKTWLNVHQAAHNSINTALGLAGNDLTEMDPRKIDLLSNWIQLHAAEHVPWGNILGYG